MTKSLCVLAAAGLVLLGCDRSVGTAPVSETATVSSRSVKSGNARDARRAEFLDRIRAADPNGIFHLYPADHGFNCDERGTYDAASAALARERTLQFLNAQMERK